MTLMLILITTLMIILYFDLALQGITKVYIYSDFCSFCYLQIINIHAFGTNVGVSFIYDITFVNYRSGINACATVVACATPIRRTRGCATSRLHHLGRSPDASAGCRRH